MTDSSQILYLANSIIGVSILTMPYCFRQCGLVLGLLGLALVGLLTKTVCHHLVKAALLARRRTYEMLAYEAFGVAGKWLVEICIIGYLMGCSVAFFVVVGDLTPEILGNTFGFDSSPTWIRNSVMIGSAVLFAYPLSLLRDIRSLGGVCTASIGFYFLLVFKIFLEAVPKIEHSISEVSLWRSSGFLLVIPIFTMAQSCQTQVFEVYDSLPEPSLKKMDSIVSRAIDLCTFVYGATGILGYIAFGSSTTGNAILDLQPSMFTEVIKFGFVLSVLVSFPLLVFPCRSSMYSMLYGKATSSLHDPCASTYIPETRFKALTAFVLVSTLLVGLAVPNIEFVLGLVGATIGTVVCVILPSMLLLQVLQNDVTGKDRPKAQVVLVVGVVILIFGTYYSLIPEENNIEVANVKPGSDFEHQENTPNVLKEDLSMENIKHENEHVNPLKAEPPNADTRVEPALPYERDGGVPNDIVDAGKKVEEPPKEEQVKSKFEEILDQPLEKQEAVPEVKMVKAEEPALIEPPVKPALIEPPVEPAKPLEEKPEVKLYNEPVFQMVEPALKPESVVINEDKMEKGRETVLNEETKKKVENVIEIQNEVLEKVRKAPQDMPVEKADYKDGARDILSVKEETRPQDSVVQVTNPLNSSLEKEDKIEIPLEKLKGGIPLNNKTLVKETTVVKNNQVEISESSNKTIGLAVNKTIGKVDRVGSDKEEV